MIALGGHPLAQTLGWALLHFLWQGALLGLLMAGCLRLLRNRTAQARYLCGCLGLVVMALMPALTFALLPNRSGGPPPIEYIRETGSALLATGAGPLLHHAQVALTPWLSWALGLWLAGVSLLSLRMFGAWFWLQGLRHRETSPAGAEWHLRLSTLQRQLGLQQTVELLKSAAVEVPMVIGWLRPVILVPAAAFLRLSPAALEAVLAHELAHIRRHDYLVNLLQSVIEILLFYHPAVWWLSAQIRTERENCCDDVAVAYCGDALSYAAALAALEGLREPALLRTELALAADGGSLMNRIQRLLLPSLPPSPNRRIGLLAALAVSVLGAGSVIRMKEETPKPSASALKAKDEKKTIVIVEDDRRIKVKSKGKVDLKHDSPEFVILGEGGSFELEVKEAGKRRVFKAARDAKGETRTYTEDGQAKPIDEGVKGWLQSRTKEIEKSRTQTHEHPKHSVHVTVMDDDGKRIEKRIVIDTEKIAQDVQRHLKDLEKHHGDLERHEVLLEKANKEMERHRTFVLKHHKGDAPEMDLDLDLDLEVDADPDLDADDEATPPPHIVMKRFQHGQGAAMEAEILRSTIQKLQQRLERLEQGAGAPGKAPKALTPLPPLRPAVPKPPRPPKAPKAVPAPPSPPDAPAPPTPPAHAVPPPPPPALRTPFPWAPPTRQRERWGQVQPERGE